MELILPFDIASSEYKISYTDKIFLIGSCFSEEIGERLSHSKFNILQNPNGILYDPLSIAYALNSYIENKEYYETDLFPDDDVWHSWRHHSVFSGTDKSMVLQKINQSQKTANAFLKNASYVIITLGTAYNYQLKSNKEFVINCHKAPSSLFHKNLMETKDIITSLSDTIKNLQAYNQDLIIIFTISPVRHIRDGVIENNRSKARLIDAVHSIAEQHNHVYYFPAYEIVIDVLRDYRFFKIDLVHVNEIAVQYVFEIFCNAHFNETTLKLKTDIDALMKAKSHKAFNIESTAHKNFLKAQLKKAHEIIDKHPGIFLEEELKYFSGE